MRTRLNADRSRPNWSWRWPSRMAALAASLPSREPFAIELQPDSFVNALQILHISKLLTAVNETVQNPSYRYSHIIRIGLMSSRAYGETSRSR